MEQSMVMLAVRLWAVTGVMPGFTPVLYVWACQRLLLELVSTTKEKLRECLTCVDWELILKYMKADII